MESPWQWNRCPPHVDEVVGGGGTLSKDATVAGTTFCQLSNHCGPQFGGGIADVSLPLAGCCPFTLGVSSLHGVSTVEIVNCVLLSQAQGQG